MGLTIKQEAGRVDYTPSTAKVSGDVFRWNDGRAAVIAAAVGANELGAARLCGIFEGDANSGDTWSIGAPLFWDASAEKIVKKALTLDGSADIYLGPAQAAKTSGQTRARVDLNAPNKGHGQSVLQQFVYEFDCQTGIDADPHVLIPAEMNPNGLLLIEAIALVTEVFAGSSEDQGIVTIEDTDGTDITTFTPTDAAADVVNDIVKGAGDAATAATGDAARLVAAGKGVQGKVTQFTSGGSPAGKMKVYLVFMPLL